MAKKNDPSEQLIVKNRRAGFDYAIDQTYEGGLVLVGSEVKSMRGGRSISSTPTPAWTTASAG